MKTPSHLLFTALSGLLLTGLAHAEASFSTWDENSDKEISLEEWDAAMEEEGVFERIDENNNGVFEVDEADEDLFNYDLSYDLDDGGHIERQELTLGVFTKHDENGDEKLSEEEFTAFSEKYSSSELAGSQA